MTATNYRHPCMHAGKNVISEKPVTLSSADLLEMENAAKETGKYLLYTRTDGGMMIF